MEINASYGATLLAEGRTEELTRSVEGRDGEETRSVEAGEKFEGYLLEMMLREMRKTVPEGLFSSSAMEMFSGMLDQHISTAIADGGGLGISEMLQGSIGGADAAAISRPNQATLGTQRFAPRADHGGHHHGDGQLPVSGRISSRFGRRTDPFHKRSRMHKGLDIAAQQGTPIRPIRPGRVVFAGERGGFGNAVIVDHGGGVKSIYAHCHSLSVQEGDPVGAGTVLGTVGSTGRSTGPHLHLEVHRDGEAVNPEPFVGM